MDKQIVRWFTADKCPRSSEGMSMIPSGELTVRNWKWWFIVDFPIKNGGSFHGKMLVHQRVIAIQSRTKEQLHLHPRIELLQGIKVASQGILQKNCLKPLDNLHGWASHVGFNIHKIMLPKNWAPLQSRSSSPISTLTSTGHNLLYPPSHVRRNGMTEHKTTEQQ